MENCRDSSGPDVGPSEGPQKRVREGGSNSLDHDANWRLEPHVCKACFGRLVSRQLLNDIREYRCTSCETSTQHTDATVGCCCGIKIRKRNTVGRAGGPMIDAGIRCIPNPEKNAAFPSAYVASEVIKAKRN